MNVHWKLDLQQTEKRYLAGIESLDTTSESCQNSWFYNVGKLVPLINHGASSSGHDVVNFKKLVAYLSAKQTVSVKKISRFIFFEKKLKECICYM